ncbi:MAG: DUF1638 domain-containing protein [Actinobacteria bacterium]|nr:DUF1638 domain-containing protein [Actinomycetota bacterium]
MSAAIVACGALSSHIESIVGRHGLKVEVISLPAILHNTPKEISIQVDAVISRIRGNFDTIAVAYADCGTYGALDGVLRKYSVARLGGNHCYDVFAGEKEIQKTLDNEAGTYLLTDFLVRTFYQSVIVGLGIDRYPDLLEDYFKNYSKVIWLAQNPTPELQNLAVQAAEMIGLPLETRIVGEAKLEEQILTLLA